MDFQGIWTNSRISRKFKENWIKANKLREFHLEDRDDILDLI